MKKIMIVFVSGLMLVACNSSSSNNGEDAVDSAQEQNDSLADASNNSNNPALDSKTTDFATEAASGGMMEVQLGQMAQQKAQSKSVKDFGAMMVADHTKANDELKALAAQKNITLPTALSDKHQKHVDDLSSKTGKDFDKAYIDMMVDDHKEDVDKFKDASQNVPDSAVKGFAAKTLPVLQKHLSAVQAIQKNMK